MYKNPNTDCPSKIHHLPVDELISHCKGCNICQQECPFLEKYGSPGQIARICQADPNAGYRLPFECSLCGLCTVICPQNLDFPGLMLDMRRKAVENGKIRFSKYKSLLRYERLGTSKTFNIYSLPEKCTTIFFPGCSLPGTRPKITLKTFDYLSQKIKHLGVVLDCCTKPSHDLGRQMFFKTRFDEMKTFLYTHGVRSIIVACPSCHGIFKTYGKEFQVQTVYEVMSGLGLEALPENLLPACEKVVVHDPCQIRFENGVHHAVRALIQSRGLEFVDTQHCRNKTYCCGQGGAVGYASLSLARAWMQKRLIEDDGRKLVSYCAGCVQFYAQKTTSFHILDLIFDPQTTMAGKPKVTQSPLTYLNRLKVKQVIKKKGTPVFLERKLPVNG